MSWSLIPLAVLVVLALADAKRYHKKGVDVDVDVGVGVNVGNNGHVNLGHGHHHRRHHGGHDHGVYEHNSGESSSEESAEETANNVVPVDESNAELIDALPPHNPDWFEGNSEEETDHPWHYPYWLHENAEENHHPRYPFWFEESSEVTEMLTTTEEPDYESSEETTTTEEPETTTEDNGMDYDTTTEYPSCEDDGSGDGCVTEAATEESTTEESTTEEPSTTPAPITGKDAGNNFLQFVDYGLTGSKYYFCDGSTEQNMWQAQIACTQGGGELVSFETEQEKNIISGYIFTQGWLNTAWWTSMKKCSGGYHFGFAKDFPVDSNNAALWCEDTPTDGPQRVCGELFVTDAKQNGCYDSSTCYDTKFNGNNIRCICEAPYANTPATGKR